MLAFFALFAQQSGQLYEVHLVPKERLDFDPYQYFDAKAIERKTRLGISIDHPTDWPVNPEYVDSIKVLSNNVVCVSRWFNIVIAELTPNQVDILSKTSFVKSINVLWRPVKAQLASMSGGHDPFLHQLHAEGQLRRFSQDSIRNKGLDGEGIRIAVFDAGFVNYKSHELTKHLTENGRIKETKSFVRMNKTIENHSHGLGVLSCIAGVSDKLQTGLATKAEFLLAKTENRFEFMAEEYNWLAAAEWADKLGADIINSSLGYTYHRYFPNEMDGQTALVSRAANMAARKGMLVVNAAGNEGSDHWHVIGAPADADSVLSIGGIDPKTGIHIDFSSFGPTSSKKRKPNLCAYGHVVAAERNGVGTMFGTSFSSPLVAGFAACLAQSDTNLRGMELFKALEKKGDLYPYFDYAHGYGVPGFHSVETVKPTFIFDSSSFSVTIRVLDTSSVKESTFKEKTPNYMFIKMSSKDGSIVKYKVVQPGGDDKWVSNLKSNPYDYPRKWVKQDGTLEVLYRGYYDKIDL
jgi:hypothetical protein